MQQKTVFSRELRLLLCPQCGAPVEAAIAGGAVACKYCGAALMLPPRDESHDVAHAAAPPQMGEAERFQRLREQDNRPLLPPPAIQHLCINGHLPPNLFQEARLSFQRAWQEVAAGGSFGAAERLYFLTFALYQHLSAERKDAEVRALLETARDLLPDPRHRQLLHGMLARNAARANDPHAAEEWLKLLTAHSADIHMDTAYRFSRAYVSTRAGDLGTVLRVLGTQIDDVPIADPYDSVVGMLRANAHERTGNWQAAVQQLSQLATTTVNGASGLAYLAGLNPELALCPESLRALTGR
jgi:DNA-directed RNA polymerase subunit RPC12/RpoP